MRKLARCYNQFKGDRFLKTHICRPEILKLMYKWKQKITSSPARGEGKWTCRGVKQLKDKERLKSDAWKNAQFSIEP